MRCDGWSTKLKKPTLHSVIKDIENDYELNGKQVENWEEVKGAAAKN